MRFQGPDSCRSWAAVCLAGLTQIPVLFSLKTMGVTFVGLLSEWQFSRHEASWPLTLLTASSQICGEYIIHQRYLSVLRHYIIVIRLRKELRFHITVRTMPRASRFAK